MDPNTAASLAVWLSASETKRPSATPYSRTAIKPVVVPTIEMSANVTLPTLTIWRVFCSAETPLTPVTFCWIVAMSPNLSMAGGPAWRLTPPRLNAG